MFGYFTFIALLLTPYDHPPSRTRNAWGMEGYFWMKRGENMCGISDCASYPLVRDKPKLGEDSADIVDDDHSAEKETLITSARPASPTGSNCIKNRIRVMRNISRDLKLMPQTSL